jgi:hypothetical protein
MSQRFEWADPSAHISWWTPEGIEEVAPDGNADGDFGISITTGSNGAMLYGSIEGLRSMLGQIEACLQAIEKHAKESNG